MASYSVICVGVQGEITLLDRNLRPVSTPLSSPSPNGDILQAQVLGFRSNSARIVLLSNSGWVSMIEVKIIGDEIKAEVTKSEWIDGDERKEGDLVVADISEQGTIIAIRESNTLTFLNEADYYYVKTRKTRSSREISKIPYHLNRTPIRN
jgi:hypothetical protein